MTRDKYRFIGVGVYPIPQAARLTKLSPDRVARWLRGYRFPVKAGMRVSPAAVHSDFPLIEGTLTLSFLDLQEVMFVGAFLGAGVKWKHLRRVHTLAQDRLGPHPFSTGVFVTDGYRIFQDLAPSEPPAPSKTSSPARWRSRKSSRATWRRSTFPAGLAASSGGGRWASRGRSLSIPSAPSANRS